MLIYPATGKKTDKTFVRSWQQEPLAIGVLAALTPDNWDVKFFDDRIEEIDYEHPADLVGISIETYTARRGYQIAQRFRERKIPVIFGGYHATFRPDEALEHGDSVCIGEAEAVWEGILEDAASGKLKKKYAADSFVELKNIKVRRSLFEGKKYLPLTLVEVARGCPFKCNFCSVSAFYKATYRRRPADEIIAELKGAKNRYVFFVDDNFTGDLEGALKLCVAVKQLKIRWMTQAGINGLKDPEFVKTMAESGCIALLVGFESLNPQNLRSMNKGFNKVEEYSEILANLRKNRIFVYGTFVFGYPSDNTVIFNESVAFAKREKMLIAAFNHLVPFPGTPLYSELENKGRLKYDKWWMSSEFYFGQSPFNPENLDSRQLEMLCLEARRKFYSIPSILKRSMDLQCNCSSIKSLITYFATNAMLRKEISTKRGIPLGIQE